MYTVVKPLLRMMTIIAALHCLMSSKYLINQSELNYQADRILSTDAIFCDCL